MTEKRFKKIIGIEKIVDNKIGLYYDNIEDILNVLNLQENKICELKHENELLKEENRSLYVDIDFLTRFIEKQGFKVKRNLKEVLELMK